MDLERQQGVSDGMQSEDLEGIKVLVSGGQWNVWV